MISRFFRQNQARLRLAAIKNAERCAASAQAKIQGKITDKVPVFDDLSVSKAHFTDKPPFSSDLSVNF